MTIKPTEAHLQKACDLLNADPYSKASWNLGIYHDHPTVTAFAKYIANQPAIAPELVEHLHDVRKFIEAEYRTSAMEEFGEWLDADAREPHAKLCAILAALDASKSVDPLVEALQQALDDDWDATEQAQSLRFELAKRGLHITEIQP